MSGITRAFRQIKQKVPNVFHRKRGGSRETGNHYEEEEECKAQEEACPKPLGFQERYDLGNELGRGNFSVVRRATDKQSNETVAVKCIKASGMKEEEKKKLEEEVKLLQQLDNPGIIRLIGFHEVNQNYFIVTEYVDGGELFDRIVEKEYYSEKDAQLAVRSIANALKYCHDNNIVHRDLKPENILLVSKNNDTNIKLADFGFAIEIPSEKGLTTACGTPGYVAPEIISGMKYGKSVDMWSFGVIIYILLCGYPPFHDENQNNLLRKIKKGDFVFDPEYWCSVSEVARALIREVLVVDPEKRMTIDELLEHPWVANDASSSRDITPAIEGIKHIQAARRLRIGSKAVHGAVRMRRLSSLAAKSKKKSATHDAFMKTLQNNDS